MSLISPPPLIQSLPLSRFKPYVQPVVKRLGMSLQGKQKTGKNHFSFTAPDPIKILTNDPAGIDRVNPARKFPNKSFDVYEIPFVTRGNSHPDIVKDAAERACNEFKLSFIEALDTARTVIVDNLSDVWLLFRLAEFGKDRGVKGIHYAPLNTEFLELLREYRTRSANLILIHKESDDRDDEGKTISGSFRREGFSKLEYAVDDVIRLTREDPDRFLVQVVDSQNPSINGKVYPADSEMAFANLAMEIFPDSTPDMWV